MMHKAPSVAQYAGLVARLETFIAPGGQAFARLPDGVHPLRSPEFRNWFFQQADGNCAVPSPQSLNAIISLLESRAVRWEPVFRRVAHHALDRSLPQQIFLDLADREGGFVSISSDVWNVSAPDAKPAQAPCFQTSRSTWTLQAPVASPPAPALATLRSLLNLPDQTAWLQCLAWLFSTLRSFGPQPFLILQGPPGCGKSFAARILRHMVDPHPALLTPVPASVPALLAVARQNWILAFDHISALSPKVIDALCRLSTGLGASLRELPRFEAEPVQQYFRRPVILTAAPGFVCPPSLAERAFIIDMPPLPPEHRRPETELLDIFYGSAPSILGVLCSAASAALARISQMPSPTGRLCDTLHWFLAAAPALELQEQEVRQALAAPPPPHPLVDAVRALLEHRRRWTGSATELHSLLAPLIPGSNAAGLSQRLRKAELTLADAGIELKFRRLPGGNRILELLDPCDRDSENTPPSLSQNSDSSPQPLEPEELKVA